MKRAVILGGGISGYGSAILAKKEGFDVFLSDRGALGVETIEHLEEWGIPYEQGQHSEELILNADLVIKSPGIPDKAPIVRKIKEAEIPIISEIEFAGRYMGSSKTICITGSNGKTTTTSLIYHILSQAGYSVAVGGNIGESFAYSVATASFDWYVLELSSFQLDGMYDFRADIALLLNITPDHLDRYDYCFENYAASKMRITQNQGVVDYFIYFAADKSIAKELEGRKLPQQQLTFGTAPSSCVEARVDGKEVKFVASKMQISGLHNLYNAEAAALAALAAGVSPECVERSICSFGAVEHRLESLAEIDGVLYINDSKATNVDSVWYALEAMTRPLVWIAGGTDKGNDYSPLKEFAASKVHTLICMGLDNGALEREFAGVVPTITSCSSFEEAMQAAHSAAKSGDVVLLSPACASFDLFKSYIHRGECFAQWVKSLEEGACDGEQ
ncbi:MAG: UDP-N-acetylmuramoyl-L-alanine--D-glutamate ligase [Rikenellaceae bacterium]